LAGKAAKPAEKQLFPDVSQRLAAIKLVEGAEDGRFKPSESV
jgi:hypothetical protein